MPDELLSCPWCGAWSLFGCEIAPTAMCPCPYEDVGDDDDHGIEPDRLREDRDERRHIEQEAPTDDR